MKRILVFLLLFMGMMQVVGAATITFEDPTDADNAVITDRNFTHINVTQTGATSPIIISFDDENFTILLTPDLYTVGTNPDIDFTGGFDGLAINNAIPPTTIVWGAKSSLGEADDKIRTKIYRKIGDIAYEVVHHDVGNIIEGDVDNFVTIFEEPFRVPDDGDEYFIGFHTVTSSDINNPAGCGSGTTQRFRMGNLTVGQNATDFSSAINCIGVTAMMFGNYTRDSIANLSEFRQFSVNISNIQADVYNYFAIADDGAATQINRTITFSSLVFSDVVNNATPTTVTGDTVNWTTTISTPTGLSFCWFTSNDTGTFVNESVQSCSSPFVFDQSVVLTATPRQQVCGFFGANTTSDLAGQSPLSCFVVTEQISPIAANATNNASSAILNDVIQWRVNATDNFALESWTFGFNASGSFVNDSTVTLSGETFIEVAVNKSVSINPGIFICGRFYVNDTFGNENQSESCFTTTTNLFRVNITAKNIFSNATIDVVNVTAFQIENSSFTLFGTTLNGLTQLDMRVGNYTFVISGLGQANTTANRSVSSSTNLTFFMQNASTVFISVFEEITKEPFEFNVTLEFIGTITAFNTTVLNSTLVTDVPADSYTLRYSSPLFDTREFFFDISTGGSASLNLFLLSEGNSSDIDGTVVDQNLNRVENVTVQALRFYLDTNTFEIVSMRKTNFDGQVLFHLQELEEFYKFIILDSTGNVLLDTTSTTITPLIVDQGLSFQINLQVNVLGTIEDLTRVSAGVFFNNATGNFRLTFADSSGLVQTGCLTVRRVSGFGITTFNQSCVNASSATILIPINMSLDASYVATGTIQDSTDESTATQVLVGTISVTFNSIPDILGLQTVFYSVMVIIGIGLAASYSPKAAIFASSFSLLVLVLAGFTVISYVAVGSIVGASIFLAIRMKGADT